MAEEQITPVFVSQRRDVKVVLDMPCGQVQTTVTTKTVDEQGMENVTEDTQLTEVDKLNWTDEEKENARNGRRIFWIVVGLFGAAILITILEQIYGK